MTVAKNISLAATVVVIVIIALDFFGSNPLPSLWNQGGGGTPSPSSESPTGPMWMMYSPSLQIISEDSCPHLVVLATGRFGPQLDRTWRLLRRLGYYYLPRCATIDVYALFWDELLFSSAVESAKAALKSHPGVTIRLFEPADVVMTDAQKAELEALETRAASIPGGGGSSGDLVDATRQLYHKHVVSELWHQMEAERPPPPKMKKPATPTNATRNETVTYDAVLWIAFGVGVEAQPQPPVMSSSTEEQGPNAPVAPKAGGDVSAWETAPSVMTHPEAYLLLTQPPENTAFIVPTKMSFGSRSVVIHDASIGQHGWDVLQQLCKTHGTDATPSQTLGGDQPPSSINMTLSARRLATAKGYFFSDVFASRRPTGPVCGVGPKGLIESDLVMDVWLHSHGIRRSVEPGTATAIADGSAGPFVYPLDFVGPIDGYGLPAAKVAAWGPGSQLEMQVSTVERAAIDAVQQAITRLKDPSFALPSSSSVEAALCSVAVDVAQEIQSKVSPAAWNALRDWPSYTPMQREAYWRLVRSPILLETSLQSGGGTSPLLTSATTTTSAEFFTLLTHQAAASIAEVALPGAAIHQPTRRKRKVSHSLLMPLVPPYMGLNFSTYCRSGAAQIAPPLGVRLATGFQLTQQDRDEFIELGPSGIQVFVFFWQGLSKPVIDATVDVLHTHLSLELEVVQMKEVGDLVTMRRRRPEAYGVLVVPAANAGEVPSLSAVPNPDVMRLFLVLLCVPAPVFEAQPSTATVVSTLEAMLQATARAAQWRESGIRAYVAMC